MIQITKAEKEFILKHVPDAHIKRTMKQKSNRHHYYCEESSKVAKVLNNYRAVNRDV